MRIYWTEDVFKIGKELEISYFEQFSNWWEIDINELAKEINSLKHKENKEDMAYT